MAKPINCKQNSDPLKLIREGVNQDQRRSPALDPVYVPVNEHNAAHGMMFAQALSAFLRYFDSQNSENGTWSPFFSSDPSLRLAVCSVQNIDDYKTQIKSYFDFLNNLDNESKGTELINNLSYIFSCIGTLAKQLDQLKEGLPAEIPLKATLKNLIQSQLAPAFQRLISYQKAGEAVSLIVSSSPTESIKILGVLPEKFNDLLIQGFSNDWITNSVTNWTGFLSTITADAAIFGNPAGSIFERTNHIATHNLFVSVTDQFLKVYARSIGEARIALEDTFTNWDRHDPHYALFLSFLRLMEYARNEANTITGRHLDFYYREILQMKEKPALPSQAHLLVELAKQAVSYPVKKDELFKAGKDDKGIEAFFANTRELIANQAKVTSLKTIYRHWNEPVGSDSNANKQTNRLFASPVANSSDGQGAKITTPDLSWHPFYNKIYTNGKLAAIQMPPAEVGFAITSHYLWLAEGKRDITIDFDTSGFKGKINVEMASDFTCFFTGEKGWIEKSPADFMATTGNNIRMTVSLAGDDAAVVAYNSKIHGYSFVTATPVMLIKLRNELDSPYAFSDFEDTVLRKIQLQVTVDQVRNLALSNDFGPVDASKPFLPFGAQPEADSSLIVGSQEIFAKRNISSCNIYLRWKNIPNIKSEAYHEFKHSDLTWEFYKKRVPWVNVTFLKEGSWSDSGNQTLFDGENEVIIDITPPDGEFTKDDRPDFQTDIQFSVKTNTGFIRLSLPYGLGQKAYRNALSNYILAKAAGSETAVKPNEPYTPELSSITADYTAVQTIVFDSADPKGFEERRAKLFHVGSFGFAEQHPWLKTKAPDSTIYLFPQLRHLNITDHLLPDGQPVIHTADFFVGITGLKPPQNLALLFQVADGTANPLASKPPQHIHWSYLSDNEWIQFNQNCVEDQTDGLLKSGIVTLSMPDRASDNNTILPLGEHWIRLAVSTASDAVCRLIMVAAQGIKAVFTDKGNDAAFASKVLPAGTISKLDIPVTEVKKIIQPFESFGGHGAEESSAFYTRVSERLRHKDRAIAIWDYERLVLEAFPEIYRVKCLNHTKYKPDDTGTGIYQELAPGHVTIVTIPNKQSHNIIDPLRPYTSLGQLQEIIQFIENRVSCFVKLHVNNPQFEEVRMNLKVRFYDGYDETWYTNLLQQSITRFLSPWAFPDGGNPTFGGKVYKSVLIDFIEEQPYVDYITDVLLFHDIGGIKGTADNNEIEGSLAISILVSVPADQHLITVINPSEEKIASEKCSCQS